MNRFLALLGLLLSVQAGAETISFAAFGDTPYRHWERENLPDMLAEMDRERLAFVVHVGDIKSSSSACTDGVFEDMHRLFESSLHPLIYTPGDNEWTDCDRDGPHQPEERLARLRQLFHGKEQALGKTSLPLERQSRQAAYAMYRENVRWQQGPLLLLTLHVPGSRNNVMDVHRPSAEFLARNAANLEWLAQGFRLAKAKALPGIVIFMHANPGLEQTGRGKLRSGYAELVQQLVRHTREFRGQVLLVHGDTHWHRIDQPLTDPANGQRLSNFTRVEVHGSPFMGWVRITADPAQTRLFRFEPRSYNGTTVE